MRFLAKAVLIAVVISVAAVYVLTMPSILPADVFASRMPDIANGETLFNIGGCASCHATPGGDNPSRLGGGLALKSPFGTFKVPNISSDANAGIGAWTEAQFANAILKGVGRNGQHLYPSLPYTSYQRMRLDDVRDLFAFLKTLPSDPAPSQPHALPFPFNVRRLVGLWKLLFLDGKTFAPDPAKDAQYNRGAYLVGGPGHCAECHSGRNVLGVINPSQRFAGGADLEGDDGWVPNITPHRDGLAGWSVADFELFLSTGLTPDGASVSGNMGEVIRNIGKLSPEDRHAMAAYLVTLPARPGAKPPKR
jgi:mono/diheme cytochrome c family protein